MADYDVIMAYEYVIRVRDASSVNDAINNALMQAKGGERGEQTNGPILMDARKVSDGH